MPFPDSAVQKYPKSVAEHSKSEKLLPVVIDYRKYTPQILTVTLFKNYNRLKKRLGASCPPK